MRSYFVSCFAFVEVEGDFAGLILWQLFGTTNQLLAGLALLAITLYLMRRGKPLIYTGLPMVFILLATLVAMASNLIDFINLGQWTLLGTGAPVFVLAIWLTLEALVAVYRYQKAPTLDGLEVDFNGSDQNH